MLRSTRLVTIGRQGIPAIGTTSRHHAHPAICPPKRTPLWTRTTETRTMATATSTTSEHAPTAPSHEDPVVLYVTCPDETTATSIATVLLKQHLVACCNLVPKVTSMYWWEGQVQQDTEVLMMIKSRDGLVDKITETVVQCHPYDVPEVIATRISKGHVPYLDWIKSVVAS